MHWNLKFQVSEEAKEIAEIGVNFCIEYGNLVAFPRLLFNKACALATLGDRKEATSIFKQSEAIFAATNQMRMAKLTADLCKKHYGIEI